MASVILKIDVFNLSFQSGAGVSSLREGERRSSQTLPAADQTRALSGEGVRLKRTGDVRSAHIVKKVTFLRRFAGLYYTCDA